MGKPKTMHENSRNKKTLSGNERVRREEGSALF